MTSFMILLAIVGAVGWIARSSTAANGRRNRGDGGHVDVGGSVDHGGHDCSDGDGGGCDGGGGGDGGGGD